MPRRAHLSRLLDALSRTGDRVLLPVQQVLDLEEGLHVATTIDPLLRLGFLGLEGLELLLPVPQDMRGDPHDLGHLTNLEENLIGPEVQAVLRRLPTASARATSAGPGHLD